MTLAVRAHPMYPRLVEAYYECRQIGAEGDVLEALDRERDAMLYSVQVMNEDASSSGGAHDVPQRDLDRFMRECTHELESYVKELHAIYEDAKSCCRELETRARKVRSDVVKSADIRGEAAESKRRAPATAAEHAAASGDFDQILSNSQQRRDHEERLREALKRKYASSIMTLKSEFMRKRKKGKLPDQSTEVLKNWWSENIVWPYPTEDDKRELIAQKNSTRRRSITGSLTFESATGLNYSSEGDSHEMRKTQRERSRRRSTVVWNAQKSTRDPCNVQYNNKCLLRWPKPRFSEDAMRARQRVHYGE